MTPHQIELVQDSFATVAPLGTGVAEIFYGRLFHLDPSLRSLFADDMQTQHQQLMAMIGIVVKGLTRLDVLVPQVAELGRRHAGYGVQPAHYDTVGAALLWTLEQGLGEEFTGEVRDAWTEAYGVLAQTMMAGAEEMAA